MIDLKRGDIVLFADRGDYTGKPRPGVIVQSSASLEESPSVTLCGMTSTILFEGPPRIILEPGPANGLRSRSQVMIDKIATVRRARVVERVGTVTPDELRTIDTNLRLWLDL